MRLSVVTAVACLSLVGLSAATESEAAIRKHTHIPAQGLGSALQSLAKDHSFQIVYVAEEVNNLQTQGVTGEFTSEEALMGVLSGTGLKFRYLDERTVTVFPPTALLSLSAHETAVSEARNDESPSWLWLRRLRLAQADTSQSTAENQTTDSHKEGDGASEKKLEEIIVTATKRQENVQDIPISIAVISSQELERRSVIGMEDYLRSIPGVNQIDTGARDNAIVIRGVTTSPDSENAASGSGATVASYFDETPITAAAGYQSGGIDVRPVDLERIEVLRGPQGTAYGSASLGGAMRLIPVKPMLDRFGAKVVASYSDTSGNGSDNSMIQGVVNIPLVEDKFALRVVGYRFNESGIYRNIAGIDPGTMALLESRGLGDYVRGYSQDDVGRMLSAGGRLAAAWQATDKLNLSMTFLTQKILQDGLASQDLGAYEQRRMPIPPQARARDEVGETFDTDMDLLNLVLNYDLGWATLTSAVSRVESGSINSASVIDPFLLLVGGAYSTFESSTAEVRVASQLQGRLQFLAGLFYEEWDEYNTQYAYWAGTQATNPYGPNLQLYNIEIPRQLDQRAVFGEISYELTDTLTATVGGRFFEYGKDQSVLREGFFFGSLLGNGIPQVSDTKDDGSTFKANLSYKPTDDALLYLSWAEGFRLGRPSAGVAAICDANNDGLVDGSNLSIESTRKIDSDFLENYEIGGKFSLFDRRLVIDASVYHISWDGLPVRSFPPPPCNSPYVANVGAATSDGAELQASLFLVKGLRFDFGAGYTKAQLSKDAPGLSPPAFKGDRLPGSPRMNANFAAQYDFSLAGHDAFVRADSFYTGKYYGNLRQTPLTAAGDYIKIDARAGVTIKALSVELFVRNLTNDDSFTWRGLSNANSFFGYRMRPRTVGIQLGYSFN